ncbi:unnamed protein product [Hymenolepis diminuta]|uniref:Uncharacterized protein n=1 Tax=Hymenolepis diminuta TaxID=6216 RepID=A0A564YT44_HYMDI|nr:unnamed protein product [Hymenolepis diminuta]
MTCDCSRESHSQTSIRLHRWTAIERLSSPLKQQLPLSSRISLPYSSNKNKISSSPGRSVLEDLRVICLGREMIEEVIITVPHIQYFFY